MTSSDASVEKFPTIEAVEMAHTRSGQDFRRHQPRIYAHAIARLIDRRPMGNAAAILAAVKFDLSLTAHVDVGRAARHPHIFRRIVGPQRAVAPAERAIAIRHLFRRATDLKTDGAAMT